MSQEYSVAPGGSKPTPANLENRVSISNGVHSVAVFSGDGQYRYQLTREWDASLPSVAFIGLNPSTADESVDDPTIRRCVGFAKAWGYGRMVMVNLFAYRATDPTQLRRWDIEPVGARNDVFLYALPIHSDLVVAVWGVHGTYLGRDVVVRQRLPNLHYLRLTQGGQPSHPLYLPGDLTPVLWK